MHPIRDKSANILVVEPSSSRRSMLSDAIKQLGFPSPFKADSIKDALSFMATQENIPDWVITPLDANADLNAMSLLHVGLRVRDLRDMRVSLLLSPDEAECMRAAFQIGLFSAHRAPSNVDELIKDMKRILLAGERLAWNDSLIASHFLRLHLKKKGLFDEMAKLDLSLMTLCPDHSVLAIQVAESLHLQGRTNLALLTLNRADGLDATAEKEAEALRAKIEAASSEGGPSFAEKHNINQVAIVDPDEAARNQVREACELMGIPECAAFEDGHSAFMTLKEAETPPDLLLMEWRIPRLSGKALVQRIRKAGMNALPIIVYSSLLKSGSDRMLTKEMGIAEIIKKPKSNQQIRDLLIALLSAEFQSEEAQVGARQIRGMIKDGKFAEAKGLFDKLNGEEKFPEADRLCLESEFAYANGNFDEAARLGVEALQLGSDNLLTLNLLGKTYMKLRKFKQAEAFFERARDLSPDNIDRLCDMAETQSEQGDFADASDAITAAKQVDDGNEAIIESEAKVALASGDENKTKELLLNVENVSGVVAFMNNRAVSLTAADKLADAIELYDKAIKALPPELDGVKTTVQYNLALALIKNEDTQRALHTLSDITKQKNSPVFLKAQSLHDRAQESLRLGKQLKLRTGPSREQKVSSSEECELTVTTSGLPVAEDIERGALRLHLIYQTEEAVPQKFIDLVNPLPHFKRFVVRETEDKAS